MSGNPEDTRRFALEVVQETNALLEEREDLATNSSVSELVSQVHSAAVDLLGTTGMERGTALQAVKEATKRPLGPS